MKLLMNPTTIGTWVLAIACVAAPHAAAEEISLRFDASALSDRPVGEAFFGTNFLFWIDDDKSRADSAYAEALKDSGVSLLRFPGGTVADNYLWQTNELASKGRFPYEDGEPTSDYHEFIAFAREHGFTPTLVVNTESFARDGRVEEGAEYAADWVRDANIENGYGVEYWEIGNETYWHEAMTALEYAEVVQAYARAMKAVDPEIKVGINGHWSPEMVGDKDRIAPEHRDEVMRRSGLYVGAAEKETYRAFAAEHMEEDILKGDEKWWPIVIEHVGDVADFLVVHIYYHHGDKLFELDQNLKTIRGLHRDRFPEKRVELALTEYNTVAKYRDNAFGKDYMVGLAGGLIQLLRAEVEVAMFWPSRIGGYWESVGLVDHRSFERQTASYVLPLFREFLGKRVVPVDAGQRMLGVAGSDGEAWVVALVDFDLDAEAVADLHLPTGWEADRAVAYEESAAPRDPTLTRTDLALDQADGLLKLPVGPNRLVLVHGNHQ